MRIHVSVAGREVLSRFTLIPVLKDKDTNKLIENEIRSQFPFIEQGDVECTHGYCEPVNPDKDSNDLMSQGRWLILAATRKTTLTDIKKQFQEVGCKEIVLVPAPIALANLVHFEQMMHDSNAKADTGAVAVDVATEGVNVVMVSQGRCFFKFTEGGGDVVNQVLVKRTGQSYAEIEKLKNNPVDYAALGGVQECCDPALANQWMRTQKIVQEGKSRMHLSRITGLWCCGQASLTPGFIRASQH